MTKTYCAFRENGGNSWTVDNFSEFLTYMERWTATNEGHVYDAWGEMQPDGGRAFFADVRRDALSAGRTLTYKDGKYTAGGVEEAPLSEHQRYAAMGVASSRHHLDAMCACCGERWGAHVGALCPGAKSVFRLAETVSVSVRPLEYKPAPIAPTLHPADARMIARDGPAKPRAAQPAPVIAAKPAPAGLCFSTDLARSSHQVSPFFGSAAL